MADNARAIYVLRDNINNQETEGSSSTSTVTSTSSTTTRARARVREEDAAARVWEADIAAYYQSTFGAALPPVAKRDIDAAMEAGIEPPVIMICIDEAALAPRPSWAYARAILRKLVSEGCCTEEQYHQRQRAWHARRADNLPF